MAAASTAHLLPLLLLNLVLLLLNPIFHCPPVAPFPCPQAPIILLCHPVDLLRFQPVVPFLYPPMIRPQPHHPTHLWKKPRFPLGTQPLRRPSVQGDLPRELCHPPVQEPLPPACRREQGLRRRCLRSCRHPTRLHCRTSHLLHWSPVRALPRL